jgi:predicted lipid-binding transport protein (Tim44 family)
MRKMLTNAHSAINLPEKRYEEKIMLANRWVRSGVVSGNRTEPVKFREYWTFKRLVGDHPWRLSAIHQAE